MVAKSIAKIYTNIHKPTDYEHTYQMYGGLSAVGPSIYPASHSGL